MTEWQAWLSQPWVLTLTVLILVAFYVVEALLRAVTVVIGLVRRGNADG